ncbi:MAG: hypothetical protein P8J37_11625 [Fuerstiella sp.]|nr:hypothetical protein [Fuerstiella sp.]
MNTATQERVTETERDEFPDGVETLEVRVSEEDAAKFREMAVKVFAGESFARPLRSHHAFSNQITKDQKLVRSPAAPCHRPNESHAYLFHLKLRLRLFMQKSLDHFTDHKS